jgi:hypothetical protein
MGALEVLVALVFAVALLAALRRLRSGASTSRAVSRPVLPSTYDPEVYVTRLEYRPGYCLDCGTWNDPEYAYCRECASELTRHPSERRGPSRSEGE